MYFAFPGNCSCLLSLFVYVVAKCEWSRYRRLHDASSASLLVVITSFCPSCEAALSLYSPVFSFFHTSCMPVVRAFQLECPTPDRNYRRYRDFRRLCEIKGFYRRLHTYNTYGRVSGHNCPYGAHATLDQISRVTQSVLLNIYRTGALSKKLALFSTLFPITF